MESRRVFSWLTFPPKKLTIRSFLYKFFVATSLELSKRTEVGLPIVATKSSFLLMASLVLLGVFFGDDAPPQPQATK